ncbi:MAG: DNA repair protein RecO [Thermomicrobiales bacterium]
MPDVQSSRNDARDRHYRTEAIILTRLDYGETDRIFTAFTPRHGKVSLIAKGARRPSSKYGSQLDYFGRVSLHLSVGRDLDVVTSAELLDGHERLRLDLDAFGCASYFAELVRHLTHDREENWRVYDLLRKSLALIDQEVDSWAVTRHFELALLSALGYQPELFACIQCREPLEATTNVFSARLGGMLCPACANLDRAGGEAMSVNAQKYLRELVRNGLASVVRLQPSDMERMEIERAIASYLRHIAERDFSSLRVRTVLTAPSTQGR